MKCAIVDCKNCSGSKLKHTDGITFHVFPVNTDIRKEWIRIVNKPNWTPTKYSKICSIHFNKKDFSETKTGLRKLRAGALPELHLPNQEPEKMVQIMIDTHQGLIKEEVIEADNYMHNTDPDPIDEKILEPLIRLKESSKRKSLKQELNRLRLENLKKDKKIKILLERNRRLKKQMAFVQSILNDVQQNSVVDILKNIDVKTRELVQRQNHKTNT